MSEAVGIDLHLVGKGLGARLAGLTAAMRRYDSFAFRPEPEGSVASPSVNQDAQDVAQDVSRWMVQRALRAACDPTGWRVLSLVAAGDTTSAEVAEVLGCPRLVAWEQANELLQVGLVSRDLDGDRLCVTEAGRGIIEALELLACAAAEAVGP